MHMVFMKGRGGLVIAHSLGALGVCECTTGIKE